jgi:hypothetical protein
VDERTERLLQRADTRGRGEARTQRAGKGDQTRRGQTREELGKLVEINFARTTGGRPGTAEVARPVMARADGEARCIFFDILS